MNARMADDTARCAEHCDGQPQGFTNDACIYCPVAPVKPGAQPMVGELTIVRSAVGILVTDEMGTCHGITSTVRGAKILRRRLLKSHA